MGSRHDGRRGMSADANSYWLWIVGRRRPGIPIAKVQAATEVLFQQRLVSLYGSSSNAAFRKTAMAQHIAVRERGRGAILIAREFRHAPHHPDGRRRAGCSWRLAAQRCET